MIGFTGQRARGSLPHSWRRSCGQKPSTPPLNNDVYVQGPGQAGQHY